MTRLRALRDPPARTGCAASAELTRTGGSSRSCATRRAGPCRRRAATPATQVPWSRDRDLAGRGRDRAAAPGGAAGRGRDRPVRGARRRDGADDAGAGGVPRDRVHVDDLLAPTFNGQATKANSSFPVEGAGVIEGPLSRSAQLPAAGQGGDRAGARRTAYESPRGGPQRDALWKQGVSRGGGRGYQVPPCAGENVTEGLVRVDQPLFLISQAQRSGGTLLLRLFDGHPECHVVPFQLRGVDDAREASPSTLGEAWRMLWDPEAGASLRAGPPPEEERRPRRRGHVLVRARAGAPARRSSTPAPARTPTRPCATSSTATSPRTSTAGATTRTWRAEKRWLVGFEPGVARSLARRTWRCATSTRTASSSRSSATRGRGTRPRSAGSRAGPNARQRSRTGARSARARSNGGAKRGKQQREVRVIRFESLLSETEETMRRIARWLADRVPAGAGAAHVQRPADQGEHELCGRPERGLDQAARPGAS